jgi:hypothetical protein
MKPIRSLLLAILVLALNGCRGTPAVSSRIALPESDTPAAWIDAPLPGAHLPLAPYEFVAHGSDQTGILQIEWTLNGAPLGAENAANPAGKLATFRFLWTPSEPGMYTLRARVKNGANAWSEFDEAVFSLGEPTSTSTPTPLPTNTATSTSTLTPAATETPTLIPTIASETPTPTLTSSPAAMQFSSSASTGQIFSGNCSPNSLDLSVSVEPGPYSVVLFVRLVDTAGEAPTAWSSYAAMNPSGGGRFSTTLYAGRIPDVQRFANAWLVYQFIATGATGEIIGRSPSHQDVMVSTCGGSVIVTPLPPGRNTVVPPPVRVTLHPPFFPSPTVTMEFVK